MGWPRRRDVVYLGLVLAAYAAVLAVILPWFRPAIAAKPAPPAKPAAQAILAIEPSWRIAPVGGVTTVDIVAYLPQAADTVDAYIRFDPSVFMVVDASGQPATAAEVNAGVFGTANYNSVNNHEGRIDLSVSAFYPPYPGSTADHTVVKVATFRLVSLADTRRTLLVLVREGARQSDIYVGGDSLDPRLEGASMMVVSGRKVAYIPLFWVSEE